MPDYLSPKTWTRHLEEADGLAQYLSHGGSLVRVVVTPDAAAHGDLSREIAALSERNGLVHLRVDAASCTRLHQPQSVLTSLTRKIDLHRVFVDIAAQIWDQAGYPTQDVTTERVAAAYGEGVADLRREFRQEVRRFLAETIGLSRDFRNAVHNILLEVADQEFRSRAIVQRLEAYYAGTLGARDLFELGIQRKVSKETATPALRNLLALLHASGHGGAVVHLDLRWTTDDHLLTEGTLARPTRPHRIAVYQWIRELIDGIDRFTATLLCVEFGPQFPDPTFNGRGWGLYDALRLRLEDGVRTSGGPNPSAPFVPLGAS